MGTMTWGTASICLILLQVNWTFGQTRLPPWVTTQSVPLQGQTFLHLTSGKAVPYPACYTIRNNAVNNLPYQVDLGNGNIVTFYCNDILRLGIPCNIILEDFTVSSDLFIEVLKCNPNECFVELSNGVLLSYDLFCNQITCDNPKITVPRLPILPDVDLDAIISGEIKPTPVIHKPNPPAPSSTAQVVSQPPFVPTFETVPNILPYPPQLPVRPSQPCPVPVLHPSSPQPCPPSLPRPPPPCPLESFASPASPPCPYQPCLPQPCPSTFACPPAPCQTEPCSLQVPPYHQQLGLPQTVVSCPPTPCVPEPCPVNISPPCPPQPCVPEPCPVSIPRPCSPQPCVPEPCPVSIPPPCPHQPCLPEPCPVSIPPPCPHQPCLPEPCPVSIPPPCSPQPCLPQPSSPCSPISCPPEHYPPQPCFPEPLQPIFSFPCNTEPCSVRQPSHCPLIQPCQPPCEAEHITLCDPFSHPPNGCMPTPAYLPFRTGCSSIHNPVYSNIPSCFTPSAFNCPYGGQFHPNLLFA